MKAQSFNSGWTWWKDGSKANKQLVHLPHDAMIREKRVPDLMEGAASGYFPGGRYFYEKTLYGDTAYEGKTVVLEFEGVYQKAKVYLNGELVASQIYGYTCFYADLTGKLRIGENNTILVEADNTQIPNSRWYTGSGIYRPVKLLVGSKTHIEPNGLRVFTKSLEPAVIDVTVNAANLAEDSEIFVHVLKDGKSVAEGEGAHREITVPDAKLWSAESPELYELRVELRGKDGLLDEATESFGIRKLDWSAKIGLRCNGRQIKLRGGCVHHDNGPLGACEFEESAYRKVRFMKEAGYNAIRSAHNPISKAMLKACDELGMYVMDETFDIWLTAKNAYDYSLYFEKESKKDVRAMIEKDFNHPCVVMYSIGNEISDMINLYAIDIHRDLIDLCHEMDATRPATNAVTILGAMVKPGKAPKPVPKYSPDDVVDPCRKTNDEAAKGSKKINQMVTMMPFLIKQVKPKMIKNNLAGVIEHEDIVGLNYGDHLMETFHALDPDKLMLNTETYPWMIGKNWPVIERNDHMVGDFMWTAWDYLGEAGIGVPLYGKNKNQFNKPYPCIAGGIGCFGLTGRIESQGYYASAAWDKLRKPYISVRPVNHSGEMVQLGQWRGTDTVESWTWPGFEGKKAEVEVYFKAYEVELFLNGSSLGRQKVKDCIAKFKTKYQPGTLKAVAYDNVGRELGTSELKTAGKETLLTVTPEKTVLKANGEDLAYINIDLTDAAGILKNMEDRKVTVTVTSPCTLQAMGSDNPWTEERYAGSSFTTYNGHALAIVRSGEEAGECIVTVRVEGLESKSLKLKIS